MGLRNGVSDIHIYWPTPSHPGLWIEMKRNKKYSLSERSTDTWKAQEKFINLVKSVGFQGHFCYGWVDAKARIEAYLQT